jgi:hypothetical protein
LDKIEDTFLITLISGIPATIMEMIIHWTLFLTGITSQNPSIFNARLLTNRMNVTVSEIVLGAIGNIAAGCAFASLIILLLKFTGIDYALLEGTLIGLINAMIQFYVLARLFTPDPTPIIPSAITLWSVYIVYCVWGTLVAYIATRFCRIKVANP